MTRCFKEKIKKYYKLILGYFFIFLGIIGLFLPILQGILFLAIGCMILSTESPRFRELKEFIKKKYPRLYQAVRSRIKKQNRS